MTYDVVVLGAGNAGQAVAGAVKKAGRSVAIIESREVGGVCPNRGCVPKKVLVAAATALDHIQHASTHGITTGAPTLDWPALIARKEGFVGPLPGAMTQSLEGRGIDVLRGEAKFAGPRSVEVDGKIVEAEQIIVATGSRPRPLSFPGAEHLRTSEDFLRSPARPEKVVFVGAGVIAFEFAHLLARMGSEVTLLEVGARPLGRLDAELVAELVAHSEAEGITIHTGVRIEGIDSGAEGLGVRVRVGEATHRLTADAVFNGAGRVANVDTIAIERAGITLDRGRPALTPSLQSKENPAVWFAGDALATAPQLSPVATYEGRLVGHNLLNPDDLREPDYSSLPSAVFTIPTVATVGLTEAQAIAQGLEVEVKETAMKGWISSRTHGERASWAKVLIDRSTGMIVGAHLLGHGAGEVIHIFSLAMRHGIPASELRSGLYAYPTFTNDIKYLV